jgi:hypothetical protein
MTINSGSFGINADATRSSKMSLAGRDAAIEVKATYTREGPKLTMKCQGAGMTIGILEVLLERIQPVRDILRRGRERGGDRPGHPACLWGRPICRGGFYWRFGRRQREYWSRREGFNAVVHPR